MTFSHAPCPAREKQARQSVTRAVSDSHALVHRSLCPGFSMLRALCSHAHPPHACPLQVAHHGGHVVDISDAFGYAVSTDVETVGPRDKRSRCSLRARVRCHGERPNIGRMVDHACCCRARLGVDTSTCRSLVRPLPPQARATRRLKSVFTHIVVLRTQKSFTLVMELRLASLTVPSQSQA
jgi:hypothetical protein